MFELDPKRTAADPRDAATVIVVRDGPRGVELFCVRRHSRSGFLGGAVVFPGGKVDEADYHPAWHGRSTALAERARAFHAEAVHARAFAIAALRESFEEAAILPVAGGALDARATEGLRQELSAAAQGPTPPLARALAERQLMLNLSDLQPFARWITPVAERRRYDTRFYLQPLPAGQEGRHDDHETTFSFWATPNDILVRWENGEIQLAPPTSRSIEILKAAGSVDEAIALAHTQPLEPVCPSFVQVAEQWILTLPGDPLHPDASAGPAAPDAHTRFVLRDGRFVSTTASDTEVPEPST